MVTRRDFFTEFGRTMLQGAVRTVDVAHSFLESCIEAEDESAPRKWLRPPGALPESHFLTTCTRCTDCQEACPYKSIRRLGPEFGDIGGTPVIIPSESPCYLCEGMPCIAACKPRALLPTVPEDVIMGTAKLDRSACYLAFGQPCDYCVTRCPIGGSAIHVDEDRLPSIHAGCAGCGVCDYLCPANAITIVPTLWLMQGKIDG